MELVKDNEAYDDKINEMFTQLIYAYGALFIALCIIGGIEGAMLQMCR